MTRQRGAEGTLSACIPSCRQLARSPPQVIRSGLTTANILDGESKISPLSSSLGTSPESWRPQNCWGLVCPRGRCRRRAPAASARRWCSAACIGLGPSSSPRSSISPGPMTTCCIRSSMRGCARPSRRLRSGVRCCIRSPLRPLPRSSGRSDRRRTRGTDETAQTSRIRRHICARIRSPGNAVGRQRTSGRSTASVERTQSASTGSRSTRSCSLKLLTICAKVSDTVSTKLSMIARFSASLGVPPLPRR